MQPPPIGHDWTRNEEAAKAIVRDRTSRKLARTKPWEKKVMKWLFISLVVAAVIHHSGSIAYGNRIELNLNILLISGA